MGFRYVAFSVAIMALACDRGWQLPVALGESRESVRRTLGAPNEVISYDTLKVRAPAAAEDWFGRAPGQSLEYYYSRGLVGRYDGERLFGVTVMRHVDYSGWIEFAGPVVDGVTLSDRREDVLRKLGKPTKVEDDDFATGSTAATANVFAAESRYFWRRTNYTIEIEFLRQPQVIDSEKKLVAPRDSISRILVYQ